MVNILLTKTAIIYYTITVEEKRATSRNWGDTSSKDYSTRIDAEIEQVAFCETSDLWKLDSQAA